ncbi:MAG: oligosaccharide flippase family protein [Geminicoccaceae bacterium]
MIRRAIALASVQSYAGTLIQFAASLVLARLLTPEAFGQAGIALAISAFANAFRDAGVTSYLVQVRAIDLQVLRAAFTVTTAMSVLAAALLLALAPLAQAFFPDVPLLGLLAIAAIGIVPFPFLANVHATLQREMRFRLLLALNLLDITVYALCALALAFAGFGVYSLIIATTLGAFANGIASLAVAESFARFRFTRQGLRPIMRYAWIGSGAIFLRTIDERAFNILCGRIQGAVAVGLFNRAEALLSLYDKIIAGIMPVLLPAFSDIKRSERDARPAIVYGFTLLNAAAMLVFGYLALVAEPAMLFLYGEQWGMAADLVPPLALAAVLSLSLNRLAIPIYVAFDRIDLTIKAQAIVTPVKVIALLLALPFGLVAAAYALAAVSALSAVINLGYLRGMLGLGFAPLAKAMLQSLAMAGCALAAGALLVLVIDDRVTAAWQELLAVGVVYALAGLVAGTALRHPLAGELARVLARARRRV